jgi:predicted hydrolase (HD superfamily)
MDRKPDWNVFLNMALRKPPTSGMQQAAALRQPEQMQSTDGYGIRRRFKLRGFGRL